PVRHLAVGLRADAVHRGAAVALIADVRRAHRDADDLRRAGLFVEQRQIALVAAVDVEPGAGVRTVVRFRTLHAVAEAHLGRAVVVDVVRAAPARRRRRTRTRVAVAANRGGAAAGVAG